MVALAVIRSPMRDFVVRVFSASAPCKIGNMVVCFVSVQVATFHSGWAWRGERFKYQCVDERSPFRSSVENYKKVAMRVQLRRYSTGVIPMESAMSASACDADGQKCSMFINRVSRKPRDYTETFWKTRIDIRHARFLQTEWC